MDWLPLSIFVGLLDVGRAVELNVAAAVWELGKARQHRQPVGVGVYERVDAGIPQLLDLHLERGPEILLEHRRRDERRGRAHRKVNAMLDAFEHYNEWSDRADDAIRAGCTLPELLEGARRQLRMGLVVADATYLIQAYSDDGDLSAGVQKEMLEAGSMPLSTILRINQDPSARTAGKGVYYVDIPEMDSRCPAANLFMHDTHEGWLIGIRQDGVFTQGELDLLGAVAEKVEFWFVMNQRHEDRLDRNAMFEELLDGSMTDADEVWRKLGVSGGDATTRSVSTPCAWSMSQRTRSTW